MIIDLYYKGKFVDTFDGIDDAQLYVEDRCEDGVTDERDFTYKKNKDELYLNNLNNG